MQWIWENKVWLFEGLGVAALSLIFWYFFQRGKGNRKNMKQKGGKGSTNVQAGRDVKL